MRGHCRRTRVSRIRRGHARRRGRRLSPRALCRSGTQSIRSMLVPRRFAFGLILFSSLILRLCGRRIWSVVARFIAFLNDQVIDCRLIVCRRLTEPRIVRHRPHQIGFVANIGQIEAHSACLRLSDRVIEPKRDRHQSLFRNVNRQQFL